MWHGDGVVFGSHERSRKARNLLRSPDAVVHLESGDDVVILEGAAERIALDDDIATVYGAKYEYTPNPAAAANEAWFRVQPRKAWAWLESEYPNTATFYAWA